MAPVIDAANLGKRYRIGGPARRADTLRESLQGALLSPFRSLQDSGDAAEDRIIWALRDVSFTVDQGELLAIIGRNGAGKSTLLKILSRITEPTTGRARLRGHVAALLEVGTGFHPDLTGRENILLNGAILGMRRAEIARKFDEIVAFAEVERFIDTPIKRYSSGMQMRLAFAVAAHLEPDVLLVDEVLAVGDIEFQRKCIGRMHEVTRREGRTVLFVSHNMSAVKALCRRAILLDGGRITAEGGVDEVVDAYLRSAATPAESGAIADRVPRVGTGEARFRSVEIASGNRAPIAELYFGEPFSVIATVAVSQPIPDVILEIGLSSIDDVRVATSFSTDGDRPPVSLPAGSCRIALDLQLHLLPGQYAVDLGMHRTGPPWTIDFVQRTCTFEVLNVAPSGGDCYPQDAVRGFVRPPGRWQAVERIAPSEVTPCAQS